jgi:hypothetical protein
MAGLVPANHLLPRGRRGVDARDKPGHDDGTGGDSRADKVQRYPKYRSSMPR